jgi:hypothetical protein
MKNLTCFMAIVALALSPMCMADILITTAVHNESFDSLPTTTVTGAFTSTIGAQSSTGFGTTGFVGTKIAGTGTAATNFIVDNGGANGGAIYSLGDTAGADRALGSVASGTNVMGFGFKLTNSTANIIADLTVAFTQENWRSSTSVVNTVFASYAFPGGAITDANFLTTTDPGFLAATGLNMVGPDPVTTNGPLLGNDPGNQVARSATFSAINLAPGASMYFRWRDVNETGNDANLAMDNLVITSNFSAIPEPSSALLLATSCVGLILQRRRRLS